MAVKQVQQVGKTERYFVEALGRGLAILDCFVTRGGKLSLGEISGSVGLNPPTTFRLLRTLEATGYVHRNPETKRYALSLKVLDLQAASLAALDFPQRIQPVVEGLNARLNESSSIAVLEGTVIRYVARVPSRRIMSINLQLGSTLPAYATSMGKVLLAARDPEEVRALYAHEPLTAFTPGTITSIEALLTHLAIVREQGFAVSNEELELGLRSAAAPIRGASGTVLAAMNVSTSAARISLDRLLTEVVPQLLQAATAASQLLEFHLTESVSSRASAQR